MDQRLERRLMWLGWGGVGERQKKRSRTRKEARVLLGPARSRWVTRATAPSSAKFVVNTFSLSFIRRTPVALAALLPPSLFPFLLERILKKEFGLKLLSELPSYGENHLDPSSSPVWV